MPDRQHARQLMLLSGSYWSYFALLGLLVPYWSLFLDHRGFSSHEIGELLAIFMATRILTPTLWAAIADRSGHRLALIRLGAGLSLIFFLGFFHPGGYWWLALVLALFASFWSAILPQLEVVTLTRLGAQSEQYSRVRLWGSVGFILLVVSAGLLFERFSVEWMIPLGVILLAALGLFSLCLDHSEQPAGDASDAPVWHLLKQPPILLFFGANLMLQVSHGPYYSFFVLYLQQLGYSESFAGYQIALGVIAEVLIFLKAGALLTHLGARNLLLVSMALSTLRWLLTPLVADNAWLLSGCQLLHAASFGTAHAASMQFLHHWFRGKHRGKGQALYASLSFGIGGALGALASGYLWLDGQGALMTWWMAALAAAMATLMVWLIAAPSLTRTPDSART